LRLAGSMRWPSNPASNNSAATQASSGFPFSSIRSPVGAATAASLSSLATVRSGAREGAPMWRRLQGAAHAGFMPLCDDVRMTRKTTGKSGSAGKGGRREGGKPGGKQGGKSGKSGKSGKRPGWLPQPPPRGVRPPPAHGGGDPYAAREAARYEQPIASRELINQTLAANDGPMDAQALAERLQLTAPDRFVALTKRLSAMLRDGQLLQN